VAWVAVTGNIPHDYPVVFWDNRASRSRRLYGQHGDRDEARGNGARDGRNNETLVGIYGTIREVTIAIKPRARNAITLSLPRLVRRPQ
jgi:hypothetical protein